MLRRFFKKEARSMLPRTTVEIRGPAENPQLCITCISEDGVNASIVSGDGSAREECISAKAWKDGEPLEKAHHPAGTAGARKVIESMDGYLKLAGKDERAFTQALILGF